MLALARPQVRRTRQGKKTSRARAQARPEEGQAGAASERIGYLSAMDLLRGFSPSEMEEVASAAVMRTYPKGSVFYTPGETGEVLFIIKRGAVQIFKKSPEGRKFVIGRLPVYAFFGEMGSVGQKMYDTFAEATEDSLICTMRRPDIERLLLSKPHVALRLLEAVSKRTHELEQRLAELAFEGLVPRAASLLLLEAEGDEVRGLSHQDIADRLGVYRETATNALKELKQAGLINIGRRHITILDREGLTRAARP